MIFPSDYPAKPLSISLPDDQGLHPAYISHGNRAVSRYLETAGAGGGTGELMFRPFLHWLDRTITSVFKEAAKQVCTYTLIHTVGASGLATTWGGWEAGGGRGGGLGLGGGCIM